MIETTKQKWRTISKLARNLGVEGDISFTEAGLSVSIMSTAQTYFVDALFKPSYFNSYNHDTPNIKVNYTNFDKTFGRFRKKENVRLSVDDKERVWHESDRKKFSMRQIDVESLSKDIPDFDLETVFTTEYDNFIEIIDDASFVEAALELHITDAVIGKASDKAEGGFEGLITNDVQTDEHYKAIFNTEIIGDVVEGLQEAEDITVEVGENKPMIISYDDDDFEVEAMIAPMVNKE